MPHYPEITVLVETSGWEQKMRNAINSNNFVKVIIRGSKAYTLKSKMSWGFPDVCRTPSPPAGSIPVPYPTLTAQLPASGLGALSNLIVYAFSKGYRSFKALFKPNGAGQNDDEYIIELR